MRTVLSSLQSGCKSRRSIPPPRKPTMRFTPSGTGPCRELTTRLPGSWKKPWKAPWRFTSGSRRSGAGTACLTMATYGTPTMPCATPGNTMWAGMPGRIRNWCPPTGSGCISSAPAGKMCSPWRKTCQDTPPRWTAITKGHIRAWAPGTMCATGAAPARSPGSPWRDITGLSCIFWVTCGCGRACGTHITPMNPFVM